METSKVNILLSLNLACWLQLETICIFFVFAKNNVYALLFSDRIRLLHHILKVFHKELH
jgi:hypothetical protein